MQQLVDLAEFLAEFCDRNKPVEQRNRDPHYPPRIYNDLLDTEEEDPDALDQFCQAMVDLIERWIITHLTAGTIFQMEIERPYFWFTDSRGELGASYYTFDWKAAALRVFARDNARYVYRCPVCQALYEYGQDCDCEDGENVEEGIPITPEEFVERCADWWTPTESDTDCLIEAVLGEGYDTYFDRTFPVFHSALEEMIDVLGQIIDATTPEERLTAVLMATHLRHAHGELIESFVVDDLGLSSKWLDWIQQEGLTVAFTQECIDEWTRRPLSPIESMYFDPA